MEGTIGEIRLFAGDFAPKYWELCQGQSMKIASNQALFSIIGTIYGGDGVINFALPDLRGRTMVHPMPAASYKLGNRGGKATQTLNQSQLPTHSHQGTAFGSQSDGTAGTPLGNYLGSTYSLPISIYENTYNGKMASGSISVDAAGNGDAHQNMQPYLGLNYVICLVGLYPDWK